MNEEQMSKVIWELIQIVCDEYSETFSEQVDYFRKNFGIDLDAWYTKAVKNGWINTNLK